MTQPLSSLPDMPEGYGLPATTDGLLSWSDVEARLEASKHYWLSTVRPDGTPHSVPRWGVWVDGRFYYDGAKAFEKYQPDYTPGADSWIDGGGLRVEPENGYLQSTGLVLDPTGTVIVSVYSSGAIGCIVPEDARGLIRYVRDLAPSVTG